MPADDAASRIDRLADALGTSREELIRSALEQRFEAEAVARTAREHAEALERPDEWEGELDEHELWSEALGEQTEEDDEVDMWWYSGPAGEPPADPA
jgi:hypothetical protein